MAFHQSQPPTAQPRACLPIVTSQHPAYAPAAHPDRADIRRETTQRVDEELAADPDQATPVHLLLFAICEELGIEVDFARLPDIFLGPDEDPPEPEAAAPLPPNPCATSPP